MRILRVENGILDEIDLQSVVLEENKYYFIVCNTDELADIKNTFDFNIENVKECTNKRHDTKIEVYNNYNFCTFSEIIKITGKQLEIKELNIYYSKNYIVCVSKNLSENLDTALKQLNDIDSKLLLNTSNPCNKVLYLILDYLFESYLDGIIIMEKKVELFEERVLKSSLKDFVPQFIDMRREVLKFTRYMTPLAYLIDIIKLNENNLIHPDMIKYFENIDIKFNKLESSIKSLNESVAYLREAYEAEVANQANNVMKIFTIVSAIFLPLMFLTGVYGMNFEYIPGMDRETGFFELTFLMFVITIGLIGIFKNKKWI